MFVKIPAARKPDKMFDMVLPACQMAMRIGFSSLVYHEDVTVTSQPLLRVVQLRVNLLKVIPGKKGASARPMKNRHTAKPAPLLMAGMHIVAMLHAIIIEGRSHLGSAFASHRFPGSWPIR
jgi:hypothetical protein